MDLKEIFEKLAEFHTIYKVPINNQPTLFDNHNLRWQLMQEENDEYSEAAENNDLVEIADALVDQLYIWAGTVISHGLQDKIEEMFNEVHRSNLSKLGEDGKPIYKENGKVAKGPNYSPPDLKSILERK